jgi:hypothetical protein
MKGDLSEALVLMILIMGLSYTTGHLQARNPGMPVAWFSPNPGASKPGKEWYNSQSKLGKKV